MEIGIDHNRLCAVVGEKEIELPSLEYQLFKLLLSEPGRTFSKIEIGNIIWGAAAPDTTIEKVASRLRERIGYNALETKRGFGYSIKAGVDISRGEPRALSTKDWYIYIMHVGFDNIYKIGKSIDPCARCNDAAAFNPRLRLLSYGLSYSASFHERLLHRAFRQDSAGRELFQLSKESLFRAINLLNKLCDKELFIDICEVAK
jgi:hypothetical protein